MLDHHRILGTAELKVSSSRSTSLAVVEIDTEATAAYIRLLDTKVARTEPYGSEKGFVTLDFDADGNVVGIEIVSQQEFSIRELIKQIPVQASDAVPPRRARAPACRRQRPCSKPNAEAARHRLEGWENRGATGVITEDVRKYAAEQGDLRGGGVEERDGGEVEGVRGKRREGLREGVRLLACEL